MSAVGQCGVHMLMVGLMVVVRHGVCWAFLRSIFSSVLGIQSLVSSAAAGSVLVIAQNRCVRGWLRCSSRQTQTARMQPSTAIVPAWIINPSNTGGLLILISIAATAILAEALRRYCRLDASPTACARRTDANYSSAACNADATWMTSSEQRPASVPALLGEVLRSWWVDPAFATLGFASAIAFFDHRERQEGYGRRETGGVSRWSLLAYWLFVYLWVAIIPPPADGRIPDGWPRITSRQDWAHDSLYLLLEVAYGVWAYDFLFFFIHWGMHACQLRMHSFHHNYAPRAQSAQQSAEMNPEAKAHADAWQLRARDVLAHAPLDGLLQVVTNILVQRSLPWGGCKSRTARAIHNILVTWMLTESHTAAKEPRIFRRVCAGVSRHRQHHQDGEDAYQQFFGYLDVGRRKFKSRLKPRATNHTTGEMELSRSATKSKS